jgi:arylsulfatase A-like enzyme
MKALTLVITLLGTTTPDPEPPNIIWIFAEDMGPDLSCYGVKAVKTPNLDRLAAEGIRFNRAYTTAPVCSTSRSAMITGMHQLAIGAQQHRTAAKKPLPGAVTPFPTLLRKAGYFTGQMISKKTDFNFQHDLKEIFDGGDWKEAAGKPFFVQITYQNTHRAWKNYKEIEVDPATVDVPPYYPDTPLVRRDIANGLEEIEMMDQAVGKLLKRLDDEGIAKKTLVVFIGDNGRCEPRGKQFLYEGGVRVPLILRWPGRIAPGTVSDDLASSIDVTASVLAASGAGVPGWMHGRDLLNPNRKRREIVFFARDKMDDTHDAMRACRDARYKYIHNLMPERAWCQLNEYKEKQYPILAQLNVMRLKGQLNPAQDRFMQPRKPDEELFDLEADPFETKNLAGDPAHVATLERLRKAVLDWRAEIKDPGVSDEFRKGGWPSAYPTKTLEEWEARLKQWEQQLLGGR